MLVLKTSVFTSKEVSSGTIDIGHYANYSNILTFSIRLFNQGKTIINLNSKYYKVENNHLILNLNEVPITLCCGDSLLIKLAVDLELLLKIFSTPSKNLTTYLLSTNPQERQLAQLRLQQSKQDFDFWKTSGYSP